MMRSGVIITVLLLSLNAFNSEGQSYELVTDGSFEPGAIINWGDHPLDDWWSSDGHVFLCEPGEWYPDVLWLGGNAYCGTNGGVLGCVDDTVWLGVPDNFFGHQEAWPKVNDSLVGQGYIVIASQNSGNGVTQHAEASIRLTEKTKPGYMYEFSCLISACERNGVLGGDADVNYKITLSEDINGVNEPQGQRVVLFNSQVTTQGWSRLRLTIVATEEFEWITFKNRENIGFNQNGVSAFYLDDVHFEEICARDYACSPVAGDMSISDNGIVNQSSPYWITGLDNAGMVDLEIYTLQGQLLWARDFECTNGINDTLFWDGTDVSGNHLPQALYEARITAVNNCKSTTFVRPVVVNQDYHATSPLNNLDCYRGLVDEILPCCTSNPNMYLNNIAFDGTENFEFIAIDTIFIGANVSATIDDTLWFQAGSEIVINDTADFPEGAEIAFVQDPTYCASMRIGNPSTLETPSRSVENKDQVAEGLSASQKLNNSAESMNLLVYPTIATDNVLVEIEDHLSFGGLIRILDARGILIYQHKVMGNPQFNAPISIPVNVKDFAPGIYFCSYETENMSLSKRFVVH